MKAIVLAMLCVLPSGVGAQQLSELTGTWRGSCSDCAPEAMLGGFGKTLVIRVSPSELTIQRDGYPAEVYRLDGTTTTRPDGRTATAMVEEGSVVLTTMRTRSRGRDEVYRTIMRNIYRVSGNTLTIERSTHANRPSETWSDRWVPVGTGVYQRR